MSFRALVLVGVAALVTALTVATGLTLRELVRWARFLCGSDAAGRAFFGHYPSRQPPSVARGDFRPIDLSHIGSTSYLLADRTYASGAAEVATGWSNALDEPGRLDIEAPNADRCGLLNISAPTYDQRGPFDAPNDSQCAPNESVISSPEAFELTEPVCIDISRPCPEPCPR